MLQTLREAGSDKEKVQALEVIVVELAARQPTMAMAHHPGMDGQGDDGGGMGMMQQMHGDGGVAACPMMGGDDAGGEANVPAEEHESHHP